MLARWTGEVFPGVPDYAGYAMAAASFLAFANALNRGSHIRVSILLNAVPGAGPAATLTTAGKMPIPELRKRNYPERMIIGTLTGLVLAAMFMGYVAIYSKLGKDWSPVQDAKMTFAE